MTDMAFKEFINLCLSIILGGMTFFVLISMASFAYLYISGIYKEYKK